MDRWLLLGASGKVGSLVRSAWQINPPDETEIVSQFRKSDKSRPFSDNFLIWDPAKGIKALHQDIHQNGPYQAMIVLAGTTPASSADLTENSKIAENVLNAALETKIPKVLIASSSAVYGIWKEQPYNEQDELKPVNEYGQEKIHMEEVCSLHRQKGLEVCCMRLGNIIGADSLSMNMKVQKHDNPIILDKFSDGCGPRRSYIGPGTLSNILADLLKTDRALPEILNVASPYPVQMEELLTAAKAEWTFRSASSDASQDVILDCNLLKTYCDLDIKDYSAEIMIDEWKALELKPC